MDKATFEDYVENRYKNQMDYYSKSAGKNQKRYKQFQWILIIFSAMTPVLAALNGKSFKLNGGDYTMDLQMLVIISAAIVAILTTGLKTFNYQELWVNYRATYEKLKPEFYYYEFNIGPYGTAGIDKESLFVTRIEAMLDAERTLWPPAKKMQENDGKAGASTTNEEGIAMRV
jgi:hypothetical protein